MRLDRTTRKWILILVAISLGMVWIMQRLELIPQFLSSLISFFSPLLLGILIAFIVNLPMRWIENGIFGREWKSGNSIRIKAKRPVSLLLAFLTIAALITAVFALVLPDIVSTTLSFSSRLPKAIQDFSAWITSVNDSDNPLLKYLEGSNFSIDNLVLRASNWVNNTVTEIASSLVVWIADIVNGFLNFFIGLVFAIYFLMQKENLSRQMKQLAYAFFKEEFVDRTVKLGSLVNTVFSKFMGGQGIEAVILASLVFVGMQILRIPYPLTISVLILVGALIPVFGAFISGAVGAILVMVQNPVQAAVFLIMLITIQTIEGNFIYPRVVGQSVGLPSMWVLFAVTFGSKLFGFFGLLLGVPALSVIYVLVRAWSKNRLEDKNIAREKLEPDVNKNGKRKSFAEQKTPQWLQQAKEIEIQDLSEKDLLKENPNDTLDDAGSSREERPFQEQLREDAEAIISDVDTTDGAQDSSYGNTDTVGHNEVLRSQRSDNFDEAPKAVGDSDVSSEEEQLNQKLGVRKSKIFFDLDKLEEELARESEQAREIRRRAWGRNRSENNEEK